MPQKKPISIDLAQSEPIYAIMAVNQIGIIMII